MKFSDTILLADDVSLANGVSKTLLTDAYVGAWDFLILELYQAAGDNNAVFFVDLAWQLDADLDWTWSNFPGPGSGALGTNTERFSFNTRLVATPGVSTNQSSLCIPVKGMHVSATITYFTPGVTNGFCKIQARLGQGPWPASHTYNLPLISRIAPALGLGVTDTTYAQSTWLGRANMSGYVFHPIAGGVSIIRVYEHTGAAFSEIFYFQTPAGSLANSVAVFNIDIPMLGKALQADIINGSGGAGGNGAIRIRPYPYPAS